jgi:hypothetical protein
MSDEEKFRETPTFCCPSLTDLLVNVPSGRELPGHEGKQRRGAFRDIHDRSKGLILQLRRIGGLVRPSPKRPPVNDLGLIRTQSPCSALLQVPVPVKSSRVSVRLERNWLMSVMILSQLTSIGSR